MSDGYYGGYTPSSVDKMKKRYRIVALGDDWAGYIGCHGRKVYWKAGGDVKEQIMRHLQCRLCERYLLCIV